MTSWTSRRLRAATSQSQPASRTRYKGYMTSSSSAASPVSMRARGTAPPPSGERNLSVGCRSGSIEREVLRLEEFAQPVVAALAADAALLDPTERRGRVGDDAAVEADHAGLDALGDAHRTAQ